MTDKKDSVNLADREAWVMIDAMPFVSSQILAAMGSTSLLRDPGLVGELIVSIVRTSEGSTNFEGSDKTSDHGARRQRVRRRPQ